MLHKLITLTLKFEKAVINDLRRELFHSGLSIQYLFSYIAELVISRDPRLESIIQEAGERKRERVRRFEAGNISTKDYADDIYQLIENNLNKQKSSDEQQ